MKASEKNLGNLELHVPHPPSPKLVYLVPETPNTKKAIKLDIAHGRYMLLQ